MDAERASGYRYTHRAYLVQLRREGAGTILIDPLPFADLSEITEAIADAEWVLHAASQDLPCLVEFGLRPTRLFDTELAARLANFERVGLAALTEQLLGFALEKHHSAADWSTRPLPASWLSYAALDVELLIDLRDKLEAELIAQGKLDWAREEFAALVASAGRPATPRPTRGDAPPGSTRSAAPGRWPGYGRSGTPGTGSRPAVTPHPGGCCPTPRSSPPPRPTRSTSATLLALPGFGGRSVRRLAPVWLDALAEARDLTDRELRSRPRRRTAAATPLGRARSGRRRPAGPVPRGRHSAPRPSTTLPPENLVAPDAVRRLAWTPPEKTDPDTVGQALAATGRPGLAARPARRRPRRRPHRPRVEATAACRAVGVKCGPEGAAAR